MAIDPKSFYSRKIGDIATQDMQDDIYLEEIDIYMIEEHPDNRATDLETVNKLAESIKSDGLGQLPLVRKSTVKPNVYEHIAGWHRILAYRKLYENGDGEEYAKIPCIVHSGLNDEDAHILVWVTNLYTKALSKEEEGHAYSLIARQVEKERVQSEKLRGVKTASAVAERVTELTGQPVSASTVNRRLRDYKSDSTPVKATTEPNSADAVLDSIERKVTELESVAGHQFINSTRIRVLNRRLKKIIQQQSSRISENQAS